MTRSGAGERLSALRPELTPAGASELTPSARSTLTPASMSRAPIAGASNGEWAMMRARAPSRACALISTAPARSGAGAFTRADGEGEDRPSARIVGQREFAAHQAYELARNRQAQSGALEAAGVRAVALLETVEDRPPAVGGHAGTGVGGREKRLPPRG